MGKGFGNLAYVRNQIWFTLSPYEQRPFAKAIKTGLPNTLRRITEEAPYVLPPLLLGYAIFAWTTGEAHKRSRKEYLMAHGGGH
jgi:ubiquinol-cytochrome c reductase subunit 8